MDYTKGHWVWLDDETCRTLAQATEIVLGDCEDLPAPARQMNQAWALWMNLVLCQPEVAEHLLLASEALLQGLAGELTSEQLALCTASRRANVPSGSVSTPRPGIVGKVAVPLPPPGTSGPYGS